LKRKTREFVASSPDLNPIYLQKPDIAKRQLFSLLMNSTRQYVVSRKVPQTSFFCATNFFYLFRLLRKSGIVQDLELSLKNLIDNYEKEIPEKWQEQIQKGSCPSRI
jgi:hypothetical protein